MNKQKCAYITYLINDAFVPGVLTLFHSLKKNKTNYNFYCMITPKVGVDSVSKSNKEIMIKEGINLILLKDDDIIKSNRNDFQDRYKNENWKMFTKLNIFNQVQFDKIVYLDSDVIVTDNIDELFDFTAVSAFYDNEALNKENNGLSAGVMVIEPSLNIFNYIVSNIDNKNYGAFTDQSLLNYCFPNFNKLDRKYNSLYKTLNRRKKLSDIYDSEKVKVLHFNGQKPWISDNSVIGWSAKKDKAFYFYLYFERIWNPVRELSFLDKIFCNYFFRQFDKMY